MKSFEYAAPKTVKQAASLLGNRWGEAEILAGGTDLITCLKQGLTHPSRVVSLKNVKDLRGIDKVRGGLRIGAMTTLGGLASDKSVQAMFPSLVVAAKGVGSPQLLAVGTVGGDLCQRPRCWYYRNGLGLFAEDQGVSLVRKGQNQYHSIFDTEGMALFVSASSLGPPLIALGAVVSAEGSDGKAREIPAARFFQIPKSESDRETALEPGEILTSIRIPDHGFRNSTYEVRHRHGLDWPYVTASVAFRLENGTASDARVVLGQVAPVPWQAGEAGKTLNGSQVNADSAAKAGQQAVLGARPLSKNAYKIQLAKTAVKRAALAAAGS